MADDAPQTDALPDDRASAQTAEPSTDEPTLTPWRIGGFLAALLVAVLVLPLTEAEPAVVDALTAQVVTRSNLAAIDEAAQSAGATGEAPLSLRLDYAGPADAADLVRRELMSLERVLLTEGGPGRGDLDVTVTGGQTMVTFAARVTPRDGPPSETVSATKRTGRWTAVLPPLVAVLIALFFRRLLIALGAAVWLGAALQTGFVPWSATWMAGKDYVWGSVADTFSLYIIGFTFSLVGMVQIITQMGGMAGVLDRLSFLARSARSTRLVTALVGLAIFFDDYANTIVTGTTMRPATDRMRISREKLAYLVDSTSAPIAGVAIISTWIGYEVGLFDVLSAQLGLGMSGYEIFFDILPLRFYCILTLCFVFLNAAMARDFGPMLRAERRAAETGQVLRPGSTPLTSAFIGDVGAKAGIPHRAVNAALPVLVVIVGTIFGMFWDGGGDPTQIGSFEAWRAAFSEADNAKVLFWAAIAGSLAAAILAVSQRLLSVREGVMSWLKAIPAMWLAVAILVLAWSIQGVCADLGTGVYLMGTLQDFITPHILPLLTFLLAAAVAFATGTSWGTMGILLPALVPLSFYLSQGEPHAMVLVLLCFGAVLDGAIFGDHCSPISDTTVMSSIASSCDHIDHVRTQFPYAVTTMLAAAGFGYVGVAFGLSPWLALLLGAASLAAVLWVVGRPSSEAASNP